MSNSTPRIDGKLGSFAAFAAGAALPLAFAPADVIPLAFLAPALLFWLSQGETPRRATVYGLSFGAGLFAVGVSWVYVAIHEFGHTPALLAGLLTAIFVLILSLYPALVGYVGARFGRDLPRGPALLLWWPALWVAGELLRATLFGGFPWLSLGYSQIDGPLASLAPVFGVFGVGWAVAFTAGVLAYVAVRGGSLPRKSAALATALALWGGAFLLADGRWTEPAGESLTVSLVQGNQPQQTKWDADSIYRRLDTYAELSRKRFGQSDLVVWPENAVTVFYHELEKDYFEPLAQEARAAGTDLLLGLPVLAEDGVHYFTGIMSLGNAQAFYFKRHLVPFGEYVPLEGALRGLIGLFDIPMSRFIPGPDEQPPLPAAGYRAAASVCYEDAFGAAVAASLGEAELLINGSNNAWYGDSLAPHQHLQISRMRALETGRPMLRATTNGISALIDGRGGIVSRSPQFETYVLTGRVQPTIGATPYIRAGDLPVQLLLVAALAGSFVYARKRNRQS